jgi:hypothetical protein
MIVLETPPRRLFDLAPTGDEKTGSSLAFLTPNDSCSPTELATVNEDNAIARARQLFQIAKTAKLSNTWALKIWLKDMERAHFTHRLSAPGELSTNEYGTLSAVYKTIEGNSVRLLIDTKNSDGDRVFAIVQDIKPELLRDDDPKAGVSMWHDGQISYCTLYDAMEDTLNPWDIRAPRRNPLIVRGHSMLSSLKKRLVYTDQR